jgi:peptide/nickel transport system permease protein
MVVGLSVGVASTVLGGLIGVLVAVWRGIDDLVMRTLDALMAFPPVFLAIALVAAAGPGTWQVIAALTLVYFPRTARITRGAALSVVGRTFVEASTSMGARRFWLMMHHILPMVIGPLFIQGTYVVARAIVIDASLSFLGLGTPPPDPTWGNMLGEARAFIREAWWMVTFPGLAVVVTTISINLIGDFLRDRMDRR